jgi:hypothetical protein
MPDRGLVIGTVPDRMHAGAAPSSLRHMTGDDEDLR